MTFDPYLWTSHSFQWGSSYSVFSFLVFCLVCYNLLILISSFIFFSFALSVLQLMTSLPIWYFQTFFVIRFDICKTCSLALCRQESLYGFWLLLWCVHYAYISVSMLIGRIYIVITFRGSFIGGWNRRRQRKPTNCFKSLKNFII